MTQDVIVQKLQIKKQGEQHYFQINIPRSAAKIVGVELGGFIKTVNKDVADDTIDYHFLRINRNKLLGEVNMQIANKPNFFYSAELVQADENMYSNDFLEVQNTNKSGGYNPPILKPFWKSKQHSHGGRKELDELLLDAETTIYGCYKDVIGKATKTNLHYAVMIYVWYQIND